MANAKIISFVDASIAEIAARTAKDVTSARISLTNAIADNTLALRHDINHLAAAINQLRRDVDAVIIVTEGIRQDVESLKQGGKAPE